MVKKTISLVLVLLMLFPFNVFAADAELVLRRVELTAYDNPKNNPTYSGAPTVEGVTCGGKKEWIGKSIAIYIINDDGTCDFYGIRIVQDTGSGSPSKTTPGKTDVEMGELIDIYMNSKKDCKNFGRKRAYIQFLDGVNG